MPFKSSIVSWIRELMAQGRYSFTSQNAAQALGGTPVAVRAALRRAKARKLLATPVRGFYVIIPPEYERLGCLPPEQFVPDLMAYLGEPYYAALLTAAQYHGAAHQSPQEFQVITSRNRKRILCGRVSVRFVARKSIETVPTVSMKNPRGLIRVSTPEMTALDLVTYPKHAGGLNHVATVLSELSEKMDAKELGRTLKWAPDLASMQRLGFLLDEVLRKKPLASAIEKHVRKRAHAIIPLVPSGPRRDVKVDEKWRLYLNTKVEPDL